MKVNQITLIGIGLISLSGCSQNTKPWQDQNRSERPNIIFCLADDASYPHFSAYGCKWISTPGFDRVAKNGILFTNAYTPNAKCAPSRACLLTGRNSWQLEEVANHISNFPSKFKSFIEALRENGYFVGYTGKGWGPGNPGVIDSKVRELTGIGFNKKKAIPPTTGISNNDYSANFTDFLDHKSKNSPWCFWYGGFEPHRRYQYGSGVSFGGKNIDQIEKTPGFWPDNDTIRNDILDYAFEIEYFDKHLEEMLNELQKRNELENTIVVVTSDNGMPFPRCKGFEYEYSNHMPLAIMWTSGIKQPGRVIKDYVSFIDFAPTFLELAGIDWEKSGMASSPGKSLVNIFRGKKQQSDRNYVLLGQERHDKGRPMNQGYPIRSIIKDGYLFQINFKPDRWPAGNPETGYLNTDGSPTKTVILNLRRNGSDRSFWGKCFGKHPEEELYNIGVDPECLINLAGASGYQELKGELKKTLLKELLQQDDPRMKGNGDVFDNYPFANPTRDGNYYERYMNGEIKKESNSIAGYPSDYEIKIIEK